MNWAFGRNIIMNKHLQKSQPYTRWRRQTIKSGSAFKGQLYFQVGQMEGPKARHRRREVSERRGVGSGRGAVAPRHSGSGA